MYQKKVLPSARMDGWVGWKKVLVTGWGRRLPWEVIRVHCKHLTWLPTHTTSRCKLMKHRVVEMVWELPEREPDPVSTWPERLEGSYYDHLGITKQAHEKDIKGAFRKLSMLVHPDKNPTLNEKAKRLFQQVLEAYECLIDPQQRWIYDQSLMPPHTTWWDSRNHW